MEEELKALKELVQEIAGKYDIYITVFSFNGKNAGISYQTHENTDIYSNL